MRGCARRGGKGAARTPRGARRENVAEPPRGGGTPGGDGEGRGRRRGGGEERGGRDKERPGARLRVTQLGNERIGQRRVARLCAAKALCMCCVWYVRERCTLTCIHTRTE